MMSRGRLMMSLLQKKDVSAEESIESTDTNDENSNRVEIFKKPNRDSFEVLHESTNTPKYEFQTEVSQKRYRDKFEVINGAELLMFKKNLRQRNRTIHYACSENDDDDFSPDGLSDEYLPPQPQGTRVQFNGSDDSEIYSNCQIPLEENNIEISSLITPSDLGVGLALNDNSYFCLDSDITAEVINMETTNSVLNVRPTSKDKHPYSSCSGAGLSAVQFDDDNNVGCSPFNIDQATTDVLHQEPALPGMFTNEDPSCPERHEPDNITPDLCLIGSSHQNLSVFSTFSNLETPTITGSLHQEEHMLIEDASCNPGRQEPDTAIDPCPTGSLHHNINVSTSSITSNNNIEPPNIIMTYFNEEPMLTNDEASHRCEPQITTDPCSTSHQDGNIMSKKRDYPKKKNPGRKRHRNPQNWKMNKIKTLRNSGLEYVSKKGKLVEKREMGPGCTTHKDCIRKCHTNFSNDHRTNVFTTFWAMGDHDKQVEYLSRFITRVQRKTVQLDNINSRRHFTYEYNLPALGKKVRVCKKMFLDTFNITDMWITTMFRKMDGNTEGMIPNDRRGKHYKRGNAINEDIKISVRRHINSIPVKESHYVRQRTSKLYFEESLSFPKLYSLYAEWMTENEPNNAKATQEQYRQIFYKEFNIDFFKPKKDQCLKCEVHEKSTESEKETTALDYALHIANKCIIRQIKENDKAEAKKSNKTLLTACFDMQKILTTPQSDVSTFYYKRKFQVFNFTIYDIGSAEGHCYVWDECIGKKGPNEIASFLFDFIKKKASEGIKEFRFYSDCCGGQNRNRIIMLMYAYASKSFGVNITHNFFEVGHSQSEGDSMHALIERRKKNQVVYVPQQWYTLIRCAKSTGKPYTVKEVSQNDILDFKSLLNLVPNWEVDKDKIKMMWSKVNHIHINEKSPNVIKFQNDFYSDQLNWIDLDYHKVKTRRLNKNKSLDSLWIHNLPIAYGSLHPITPSKYKDLNSLCSSGAIPEQYRMFYVNLPHSNTTLPNLDDSDIGD